MAVERPILVDVPEQFVGARILLRPLADADVAAVHTAIGESREHLQPWMPCATAGRSWVGRAWA
jgi:hypothetical protein